MRFREMCNNAKGHYCSKRSLISNDLFQFTLISGEAADVNGQCRFSRIQKIFWSMIWKVMCVAVNHLSKPRNSSEYNLWNATDGEKFVWATTTVLQRRSRGICPQVSTRSPEAATLLAYCEMYFLSAHSDATKCIRKKLFTNGRFSNTDN